MVGPGLNLRILFVYAIAVEQHLQEQASYNRIKHWSIITWWQVFLV